VLPYSSAEPLSKHLGAYIRHEDPAVTLYREWAIYKDQYLHYAEQELGSASGQSAPEIDFHSYGWAAGPCKLKITSSVP
jgi:hypothetical protein